MSDKPASTESTLEEQLVAYLDGELDAESTRRIDELLASSTKARRRLQQLDRAWELLDELDTPQVGEAFTHTTLEMVTTAASEEAERSLAEAPRRRRRRRTIAAAALLTAGLAGFLTVYWFWPDPNKELIRNLPVLERLDEYQHAGDIEFLRMLHQRKLFSEEDDNGE
ncbi:MAG: hypothetical protein A2V70_15250 [Planctomycetes bacterium RBG_13_63_9]|nr:MAG: hypothetical protein A2V70_15250 [Planctomycetes bacterium RBG_13_63_9]